MCKGFRRPHCIRPRQSVRYYINIYYNMEHNLYQIKQRLDAIMKSYEQNLIETENGSPLEQDFVSLKI